MPRGMEQDVLNLASIEAAILQLELVKTQKILDSQ